MRKTFLPPPGIPSFRHFPGVSTWNNSGLTHRGWEGQAVPPLWGKAWKLQKRVDALSSHSSGFHTEASTRGRREHMPTRRPVRGRSWRRVHDYPRCPQPDPPKGPEKQVGSSHTMKHWAAANRNRAPTRKKPQMNPKDDVW